MKKRFIFQCWNCKRKYSLQKEITAEQELLVACPFCGEEAVVKLEPFKKDRKTVLKSGSDQREAIERIYQFPAVIPTEKPD